MLDNGIHATMMSVTSSSAMGLLFFFVFFTQIPSYRTYPHEMLGMYEQMDTAQA